MAADATPAMPGFKLIYRATGMTPVRMLHIVATAFAVGGTGLALLLLQAPQQQSISSASKLAWAAILFALAMAAPIGAYLHGRHMVARLWLSDDKTTLRLEEPTFFGSRQRDVPRAAVRLARQVAGDRAGEKALAPRRLDVEVRDGANFVVVLDGRAADQRDAVLAALQG